MLSNFSVSSRFFLSMFLLVACLKKKSFGSLHKKRRILNFTVFFSKTCRPRQACLTLTHAQALFGSIPPSQPRKFLWNELRNESIKEERSGQGGQNAWGLPGKSLSIISSFSSHNPKILHLTQTQNLEHRPQRPW